MPTHRESLLQLLLVVEAPPPGVLFAVQRGRSELLSPCLADEASIAFAVTMHLVMLQDGSFNFRGPFAQGTPDDRFVYVNSGTLAGQVGTSWTRRAKIKLTGIPRALIEAAVDDPDRAVEARIVGTAPDGGPVCASVEASAIAWRLATREARTSEHRR